MLAGFSPKYAEYLSGALLTKRAALLLQKNKRRQLCVPSSLLLFYADWLEDSNWLL